MAGRKKDSTVCFGCVYLDNCPTVAGVFEVASVQRMVAIMFQCKDKRVLTEREMALPSHSRRELIDSLYNEFYQKLMQLSH